MRLWHESLLPLLPRAQLLGQHRECCALRGGSWGRKHAVVDYVFVHPRGDRVEPAWRLPGYRGRVCPGFRPDAGLLRLLEGRTPIYPEHDDRYLRECVDNLAAKGIRLEME